ncbi:aldose epimerase family protein [Pelagibacterium lacus]|uniref:Aldose 1-epimerase n=1 Tax=Pelagibacterium lacus TaxID=2282655 RepID=A0A369W2W4_9HYPH|nr:aldose epimerase family protein [Pelagibacterium lacus]RDE08317.1 galactose mutarotase [Pelagibacterium lacus]
MPRRTVFGEFEGHPVEEVVLTSAEGVTVAILNYGALVRDWRVPVDGTRRPVVLGFEEFPPYLADSAYFGAICGRVGNRIGGARFTLDGVTHRLDANEGRNHLHGGPKGSAKRLWTIRTLAEDSVTLTLHSPDGDMGYPGALDLVLTYRLSGYTLELEWEARTDQPTPVNIIQHNYFNLMGHGDVLDHRLAVAGTAVTTLGDGQIPTGAIDPIAGTRLDFRAGRTMRDSDGAEIEIDNNFVLPTRRRREDPVGRLVAPDSSLTLEIFTDQPGLQIYNGWKIEPGAMGLNGEAYGRFAGVCLEDQNFPDAINHPHFPDCVATPQRPYRHWCAIAIRP